MPRKPKTPKTARKTVKPAKSKTAPRPLSLLGGEGGPVAAVLVSAEEVRVRRKLHKRALAARNAFLRKPYGELMYGEFEKLSTYILMHPDMAPKPKSSRARAAVSRVSRGSR